jgi:hypothetical protein
VVEDGAVADGLSERRVLVDNLQDAAAWRVHHPEGQEEGGHEDHEDEIVGQNFQ